MEEEKQQCHNKVMVAIDERDCSYDALIWVLKHLKESITKSPLVLFAAQPLPKSNNLTLAAPLGFARMYCPESSNLIINSVKEKNEKISRGLLEKAKGICESHGVKVETITEVGDPKEAICNAVKNYKINILVVGDQTDGIFQKLSFPPSQSNWFNAYIIHYSKGFWSSKINSKLNNGCRVFQESLSSHCLKNAECPVLVVNRSLVANNKIDTNQHVCSS
ncbi:hypothetical protein DITRI_Ditri17bG0046700 [Diplodiscus trichospermus]